VIDWLLAPSVVTSLRGSKQATWKPRLLAATALLWATSDLSTLHARFVQARKVMTKVFRWQPAPGMSAQGFLKMLGKWQQELRGAILPHLRGQMQEGLPEHWLTAGDALFAVDGSRVALARTKSLEAVFAPPRCWQRKPAASRGGPLQKGHLPAVVVDSALARGQRVTVGVADRTVRSQ